LIFKVIGQRSRSPVQIFTENPENLKAIKQKYAGNLIYSKTRATQSVAYLLA
jgi:hypothetical protein